MAEEYVNKYMSYLYTLNNLCKILEVPKEVEDRLVSIDNDIYSMFTEKHSKEGAATQEKISEKSIDLALKASSIFAKYSNIEYIAQKIQAAKQPHPKKISNIIKPSSIPVIPEGNSNQEGNMKVTSHISSPVAPIPESLKPKPKPKPCVHEWEIAKYSFLNDRVIIINKCTQCTNEAKHSTLIKELSEQYSFIKLIYSSPCSICKSNENTDNKTKLLCGCIAHYQCLISQLRNQFNLKGISSLRNYICPTHTASNYKDMTSILGRDQDSLFAIHYYNNDPKHKSNEVIS